MFSNIYDDSNACATPYLNPANEAITDQPASVPRVLVPDSDNDDSLGVPPTPSSTPSARPRAFSKRAAKCAAELLKQHDKSSSMDHRDRCMQQLRRLGGAYLPLGQGHTPTVWVQNADLNARVIRETEAYFDGHLSDRLRTPQVTRGNGALRASTKAAVQLSPHERSQLCGARHPLPGVAAATCGTVSPMPESPPEERADGFVLSRGEQFALSLLTMEDGGDVETTQQLMPTYLLRKDAQGKLQRVSLSSAALQVQHGNAALWADTPRVMSPMQHCWVYDDNDDDREEGLSSVQTSPSAAQSSESPGAATLPRKRSRATESASPLKRLRSTNIASSLATRRLSFDREETRSSLARASLAGDDQDDAFSLQSFSVASSSFPAPKSLSATVIEQQNYRVQQSLLWQQSLFSPF